MGFPGDTQGFRMALVIVFVYPKLYDAIVHYRVSYD